MASSPASWTNRDDSFGSGGGCQAVWGFHRVRAATVRERGRRPLPNFEFRRFQRWRPGRPATAMEGRLRGKQRCFHCWRRGAAVSAGAAGHFQQLLQLLSRDTALRAEVGSILLPGSATEARPHVRKRGARACAGATASRGSAHSDAPRDRTRPRSGDTTPGPSAPSVRRRAASDGLDPVDRAVACRSPKRLPRPSGKRRRTGWCGRPSPDRCRRSVGPSVYPRRPGSTR